MWKRGLFGTLLLALCAYAQGPKGPFRGGIRILGAQPGRPGRVVKGAPYSAEVSTEITQTLPDGNKIHQLTSERVYRDSEGRTRREPSLSSVGLAGPRGSAQLAFIDDPVAETSYVLDLGRHTATKMPWRQPPPNGSNNRPSRSRASEPNQVDPNRKVESLGRQTIAGVVADGTRTTEVIPAGQIGNALPIQIVTERWYSPDLQTVILQKRSDPRSGEYVYQWTGIVRAEPPSTMFVVPSDFPVSQGPGPRQRGPRNEVP
jgi:hypothetical protein